MRPRMLERFASEIYYEEFQQQSFMYKLYMNIHSSLNRKRDVEGVCYLEDDYDFYQKEHNIKDVSALKRKRRK